VLRGALLSHERHRRPAAKEWTQRFAMGQ
jgi:hypothetical protein